jgi:hypothetical protein
MFLSSSGRKSRLCVSLYITGLATLQILGVKMATGGSTESNVRSFEAFLTTYYYLLLSEIF